MRYYLFLDHGFMGNDISILIKDHTIFSTSRCTNKCIMCCQPPSKTDDSDTLFMQNMDALESINETTNDFSITGGEPTLIGSKLYAYVKKIKEKSPCSNVHILTNGRIFANTNYIIQFTKNIGKDDASLGIPLHSDNNIDHDYIAGAPGSFFETVKGLQTLGSLGYNIELRVIIMKQNYLRLPNIAEFITLNLPFVSQVSFMGLEVTGYAHKNFEDVWIDPIICNPFLFNAVSILRSSKIDVKLFNLPLCLLDERLWNLSCKSISSWKKTNLKVCKKCALIDQCCGVFSTSSFYSPYIRAPYVAPPKPVQQILEQSPSAYVRDFFSKYHLSKGSVILDAACGYGRNAIYMAKNGFEVVGVDIDRTVISVVNSQISDNAHIKLIHNNIIDFCLNTEIKFDCITNIACFKDFYLPYFYQVLKPGGYLVVESPYSYLGSLDEKFNRYGFTVLEYNQHCLKNGGYSIRFVLQK